MELLIGQLLAYLISLAASLRHESLASVRAKLIQVQLAKDSARVHAIQDIASLTDQLRQVGVRLARSLAELELSERERVLFRLLIDEAFQDDIALWLSTWDTSARKDAEAAILTRMQYALGSVGDHPDYIASLKDEYFSLVEKAVFSDPVLAHWRLQLGLSLLLERMDALRDAIATDRSADREHLAAEFATNATYLSTLSEEVRALDTAIVRRYSDEQRQAALGRYRTLALESCDIVDLANLPESDRHIATRLLELRRLYVPLRVHVDVEIGQPADDARLRTIERRRDRAKRNELPSENERPRFAPGHRLSAARRLVVLGDPGAGKTTLLRWIATVYLLRLREDPALSEIPDISTLPDEQWLPILIRCRDLDSSSLSGAFEDVFSRTFRMAELNPDEACILQATLRDRLATGNALLLVDGLDEITAPTERLRFCRQIETLQAAYPSAPMVITSRVVGYREMGYRIGRTGGAGRGFEHVTLADLSKSDKDDFARRWCALTEPPERIDKSERDLISDIHSTERIERLTGNPMLLTTLALVKRKVGKLPHRRAELYYEAVQVLLNWRAEVDEPIDSREALYQLEYVAHDMCRRGLQRLPESELIALFERIRAEYPSLRPLRRHEPEEFLRLLERRTGIVVEAGRERLSGIETPVYEFRHLTFQEFLAGRALAFGRFPNRDKSVPVANYIGPLAGEIQTTRRFGVKEPAVPENWREPLRLCVSCCADEQVDELILAISGGGYRCNARERRARVVMAALCLADEPNVSDHVAEEVLGALAASVTHHDAGRPRSTSLADAVNELSMSEWADTLQYMLANEFTRRGSKERGHVGVFCGRVGAQMHRAGVDADESWQLRCAEALKESDEIKSIAAALEAMYRASARAISVEVDLIEGLRGLLQRTPPATHASAWALAALAGWPGAAHPSWTPSSPDIEAAVRVLENPNADPQAVRWLANMVGTTRSGIATKALLSRLEHEAKYVRKACARALGHIGDEDAVNRLIELLVAETPQKPDYVAEALGLTAHPAAVVPLIRTLPHARRKSQYRIVTALERIGDPRAIDVLLPLLTHGDKKLQRRAAQAIGSIGSPTGIESLVAALDHPDRAVREACVSGIAMSCEDETDRILMGRIVDPLDAIDNGRILGSAQKLGISPDEVRARYMSLAERFSGQIRIAAPACAYGADRRTNVESPAQVHHPGS